jgi:hypothetical protein
MQCTIFNIYCKGSNYRTAAQQQRRGARGRVITMTVFNRNYEL